MDKNDKYNSTLLRGLFWVGFCKRDPACFQTLSVSLVSNTR